jgi:hypothetical protein
VAANGHGFREHLRERETICHRRKCDLLKKMLAINGASFIVMESKAICPGKTKTQHERINSFQERGESRRFFVRVCGINGNLPGRARG